MLLPFLQAMSAPRILALHGGHVIIATHGQNPEGPTPADQVDGPGPGESTPQIKLIILLNI